MKTITRVMVGLVALAAGLSLADCPEGMMGSSKIAVEYIPGPNIDAFPKLVEDHLKFLLTQMQNGNIEYAGPFLRGEGIEGGLTIYNSVDEKKISELVQQDRAIREKAFEFKTHLWMQCSPQKKFNLDFD